MKKYMMCLIILVLVLITGCAKEKTLSCTREEEMIEGSIQIEAKVIFKGKKVEDVIATITVPNSADLKEKSEEKYPGITNSLRQSIEENLSEFDYENIKKDIKEEDGKIIVTLQSNDLAILDDVDREVENISDLKQMLEQKGYTCQ